MGAEGLVVTTCAMLDSGSEITLVNPSLVSSLRLIDQPDRLVLSTVNSQEPQEGERVDLVVESLIDEQPQRLQLKGHSITPPRYHQRQGKMATSSGHSLPRGHTTEGIADHRNQRS